MPLLDQPTAIVRSSRRIHSTNIVKTTWRYELIRCGRQIALVVHEYHNDKPNHAERTSLSSKKSKYVKAIAIQKLWATPRLRSTLSSSSSNPVTDLTVSTGVLSWNVTSGVGVGGGRGGVKSIGESVNDKECDGAWFLNVDNTRPKKPGCWSGCGTCVCEWGAKRNGDIRV